jgi:hypothetical protein
MSRADESPATHAVELDPFVGEPVRVGDAAALYRIGDTVRAAIPPRYGEAPDSGIVVAIMVQPGGFFYLIQWPERRLGHHAFELIAEGQVGDL